MRYFGIGTDRLTDLSNQLAQLAAQHAQTSATRTKRSAGAIEIYQAMPVDVFPSQVRTFIDTVADAIGCDPVFVAMPLLPALAGCIGNTHRIKLKSSWAEPATVWALTIAPSGQHKTPAMKHAHWPLHDWQEDAFRQYAIDQAAYEEELEAYQDAYKGRKNNGPKPPKPTPPSCVRYFVTDTTMEALIPILDSNWRGLSAFIDEGTLWFQSFGQYKGGRGSDVGHWLSMADAGPLTVDRKAGVKKSYSIRRANVSIATGTQPETLRVDSSGNIHNGLLPRFLLAMPPRRKLVWSEKEVPEHVGAILGRIYTNLLSLQPGIDDRGVQYPIDVPLTPEAKELFAAFFNRNGEEQAELTGALASAWSKLAAYAGRLALVLHLTNWAAEEEGVDPAAIDAASMGCAIRLVEWFKIEARRVYATLSANEEDQDRQALAELLQRHGKPVTARDLSRLSRRYGDSESAEEALDDLAKCGFGKWDNQGPSDKGGRPTRRFVLNGAVDETPANSEGN